MEKKKPDSVKFIIHAIVWSLLIVAFIHVIAPVVAPDPREPEVRNLAQQMITLPPDTLQARLASSEKPTLLFVYASWCGYCQRVLPQLVATLDKKTLERINFMLLSIDGDKRRLAVYLVHAGYGGRFTPYIIPEWQGDGLKTALQKLGTGYQGAIPYIALFHKANPVSEISGMPAPGELQNLLHPDDASANSKRPF